MHRQAVQIRDLKPGPDLDGVHPEIVKVSYSVICHTEQELTCDRREWVRILGLAVLGFRGDRQHGKLIVCLNQEYDKKCDVLLLSNVGQLSRSFISLVLQKCFQRHSAVVSYMCSNHSIIEGTTKEDMPSDQKQITCAHPCATIWRNDFNSSNEQSVELY
jgi:hypothetical protein